MKLTKDCFVMRNELCVSFTPSVEPTIMPSLTLHRRGSPDQPSRLLPSNSGRKPSSAKAAREQASIRSDTFPMVSGPFDFERPDLHVFLGPVLRTPRQPRNLLDYVEAFNDLAEDAVLVIEPGRRRD